MCSDKHTRTRQVKVQRIHLKLLNVLANGQLLSLFTCVCVCIIRRQPVEQVVIGKYSLNGQETADVFQNKMLCC